MSAALCRRLARRPLCTAAAATPKKTWRRTTPYETPPAYNILGSEYPTDEWSNLTPRVLSLIGRRLTERPGNPLKLLKQRILAHFYAAYPGFVKGSRSPRFSLHEIPSPVVTLAENFDSLLVPADHPSRSKSDTYYVNSGRLLRAHTSAHQHQLIKSGLDAFLILGDVYRRDQVDKTHFPVFHQMEGVCLFTQDQLANQLGGTGSINIFDPANAERRPERQEGHSSDTAILLSHSLKAGLEALARSLYGDAVEMRWVDAYFPFTHPSWELEVNLGTAAEPDWLETLGCGLVEQRLLRNAGAGDKVGWAFGLGLERVAMKLYGIPDIRLFWSEDPGFLRQFETSDVSANIQYEPIGRFPPRRNDLSFWLHPGVPEPETMDVSEETLMVAPVDILEVVREEAGDVAEDVVRIDDFTHPKTGRRSHCYRITYLHMERALPQTEVGEIHARIAQRLTDAFRIEIR